jgi:hypothetical protein
VPTKQYLLIKLDWAEGEYKGYGVGIENQFNHDAGYIKIYRSYKPNALGFFKAWLNALEKCNPGKFVANNFMGDEAQMVNLLVGVVLGFEEYMGKDNEPKQRLRLHKLISLEDVRKGNYKVPDLKTLPAEEKAKAVEAPAPFSDDCPF